MSLYPKKYPLFRLQPSHLFWVRAKVGGRGISPISVRLLVDTGSSFTIVPPRVITNIGCDLDSAPRRYRITTGSGKISAPVVRVPWFNCIGKTVRDFELVAYDVPPGLRVDGLLGMDFLDRFGVTIAIADRQIQ